MQRLGHCANSLATRILAAIAIPALLLAMAASQTIAQPQDLPIDTIDIKPITKFDASWAIDQTYHVRVEFSNSGDAQKIRGGLLKYDQHGYNTVYWTLVSTTAPSGQTWDMEFRPYRPTSRGDDGSRGTGKGTIIVTVPITVDNKTTWKDYQLDHGIDSITSPLGKTLVYPSGQFQR